MVHLQRQSVALWRLCALFEGMGWMYSIRNIENNDGNFSMFQQKNMLVCD